MTVDEFLLLSELYTGLFPSQAFNELKQFRSDKAKRTFKPENKTISGTHQQLSFNGILSSQNRGRTVFNYQHVDI